MTFDVHSGTETAILIEPQSKATSGAKLVIQFNNLRRTSFDIAIYFLRGTEYTVFVENLHTPCKLLRGLVSGTNRWNSNPRES